MVLKAKTNVKNIYSEGPQKIKQAYTQKYLFDLSVMFLSFSFTLIWNIISRNNRWYAIMEHIAQIF